MSHRVQTVAGHLSSSSTPMSSSVSASPVSAAASPKLPSDIVVISALRTPICKARRGGLKDTSVEDLLAVVIKATIERTKIDPSVLGDIVLGSVLGLNVQRANEARIGAFLAGVPSSVPLHVVNRQCSSGLQAVAHVAASIRAGYYEVGLACGLESMTQSAFTGAWQGALNPNIFLNADAKNCLLPMGITSENVASKYGVSRKVQDELSARSHQNAARAIREGKFKAEIVPVPTKLKDANGVAKDVVIDTDDGVRADTTAESLSKLPAVFQKGGSTTAGNSSQVSDGAAAVLVSSRAYAEKHKLPVLGVFRSFAVTGVPPEIMGIGPAAAIPLALAQAGLTVDDIDVFEINEAFASQAAYCVQHLKIPPHKVNPNGGAIAIGHPLGATGARLTATLLHEMHRSKRRYGVVSMCIGSGMGAAAVYEVQQ